MTTFLERMQRVQTRMRRLAPFTIARTVCRLGSKRRGPTLCAWDTVRPTTGPLSQISQRLAMTESPTRISLARVATPTKPGTTTAKTTTQLHGLAITGKALAAT